MTPDKKFTINYLKSQVSAKRFDHILSVAEHAKNLAIIYNENADNAELAGLLHDLTREWPFDTVIEFMQHRLIGINDDERNHPILLHGKVASIVAKEKFNIDNQDILNSVSNHTLGSKNMSQLEMIIFISDTLTSLKNIDKNKYQLVLDTASKSLINATNLVYDLTYKHLVETNTPIAKEFYDNWCANKNQL